VSSWRLDVSFWRYVRLIPEAIEMVMVVSGQEIQLRHHR